MAETTRKGVWDLQQVRDQILDNVWEQQFELFSWGRNNDGQLGQNIQYNFITSTNTRNLMEFYKWWL
jgi:hypothetical protein